MKPLKKCFALALAFIFLAASTSAVFACGTERWKVKVAQDNHVKYFFQNNDISTGILETPTWTTISILHNMPYPFPSLTGQPPPWSYYQRAGNQTEFTIWKIKARLTKKKNEADEDYHLVLKSGTKFLVAEMPSPNCVEETVEPLKSMIIKAREDFDEWRAEQPGSTFNQKVIVTGLGFFDRVHGAEGSSPNGVELHPVIKIEFVN